MKIMNKRIKKKRLRVNNSKEISSYRLRLLYKQVTCIFERLPDLSVLAETINNISVITCKLLETLQKKIQKVNSNEQKS